ncbi:hypothetical protein BDZ91DRAFT_779135 [Kalaharituber pfeilii]|nr:hypothetical protein BDZ91DRAFT_779135 [Kalaharituber pfeilii]
MKKRAERVGRVWSEICSAYGRTEDDFQHMQLFSQHGLGVTPREVFHFRIRMVYNTLWDRLDKDGVSFNSAFIRGSMYRTIYHDEMLVPSHLGTSLRRAWKQTQPGLPFHGHSRGRVLHATLYAPREGGEYGGQQVPGAVWRVTGGRLTYIYLNSRYPWEQTSKLKRNLNRILYTERSKKTFHANSDANIKAINPANITAAGAKERRAGRELF